VYVYVNVSSSSSAEAARRPPGTFLPQTVPSAEAAPAMRLMMQAVRAMGVVWRTAAGPGWGQATGKGVPKTLVRFSRVLGGRTVALTHTTSLAPGCAAGLGSRDMPHATCVCLAKVVQNPCHIHPTHPHCGPGALMQVSIGYPTYLDYSRI
jgi:hypothetical protein